MVVNALRVPDFVEVPDPTAGAGARGRIRYDRRDGPDRPARRPPLVLIGGMTQTISSWAGQLRPLSESRPVLAYEARGQGRTQLDLSDTSLPRHVEDLAALVEGLSLPTPLDLCGFSFGGRVALAAAAQRPDLVRRLVVSGVGRDRTVLGKTIVEGWLAALRTGDLDALARISLSDIVGPDYLEAHGDMVEPMIRAVIERNSFDGIVALFRDTLARGPDSPWAPDALAPRVRCPALVTGGAQDRIAPPAEVRALASMLRASHRIFDGAGHTVPIEVADPWRRALVAFLDAQQPNASTTVNDGTVPAGMDDPAEESAGP